MSEKKKVFEATHLKAELNVYENLEDSLLSVWVVSTNVEEGENSSMVGWIHNVNTGEEGHIFSFFNPTKKFPDVICWEFTVSQLSELVQLISRISTWKAPKEEVQEVPDIPDSESKE